MFKHRREINEHFNDLFTSVLEIPHFIRMFAYSQREFGLIDLPQTDLMFKILNIVKLNELDFQDFVK